MTERVPLDIRCSPDRVWYQTVIENGIQLWASREWASGERAEYERVVLTKPKPLAVG